METLLIEAGNDASGLAVDLPVRGVRPVGVLLARPDVFRRRGDAGDGRPDDDKSDEASAAPADDLAFHV